MNNALITKLSYEAAMALRKQKFGVEKYYINMMIQRYRIKGYLQTLHKFPHSCTRVLLFHEILAN